MHVEHQESAMTEISLALAMAFFSIMVLTMVSMGVGEGEGSNIAAAKVAPAIFKSSQGHSTQVKNDDLLVIFHNGTFYDRRLIPTSPKLIDSEQYERVILAIDPSLPLSEAVRIRSQINLTNLIISTLDERWLSTLGE